MDSLIFRVIILLLSVPMILFYGILMVGAIVNLPDSWIGFLYCLTGMISGILCVMYFFKKNKIFLAIIAIFVVFMIITLSGVVP
jgi:hypothetical protein